jgi:hypothetical protein
MHGRRMACLEAAYQPWKMRRDSHSKRQDYTRPILARIGRAQHSIHVPQMIYIPCCISIFVTASTTLNLSRGEGQERSAVTASVTAATRLKNESAHSSTHLLLLPPDTHKNHPARLQPSPKTTLPRLPALERCHRRTCLVQHSRLIRTRPRHPPSRPRRGTRPRTHCSVSSSRSNPHSVPLSHHPQTIALLVAGYTASPHCRHRTRFSLPSCILGRRKTMAFSPSPSQVAPGIPNQNAYRSIGWTRAYYWL